MEIYILSLLTFVALFLFVFFLLLLLALIAIEIVGHFQKNNEDYF